jgi:hypothetical protein
MMRLVLKLSAVVASVLLVSSLTSVAQAQPRPIVHLVGSVNDNGAPASGAAISAAAWPDWQFLSLVAANQAFDLKPLGSVTADETGGFAMDIDLSTLPGTYVSEDGHVEIEVTAIADSKVRVYFTMDALANQSSNVTIPPMNLAEGDAPAAARTHSATGVAAPAVGTCSPHWISGSENGPYQTKLMDVFATGMVTGTGTYSNGGSTSTTLGVEAQNVFTGNWSASGTSTIGTSSSTGFQATTIKDKRLFGQFIYRKYIDAYCQTLNKPNNYYGRGNTLSITHPNYSNCGSNYFSGDIYTHTNSANQTYSNGLTVFTVSLTSHAGYVTTSTLKFNFNARGNVCGNNSTQGEASPIVEASTQ